MLFQEQFRVPTMASDPEQLQLAHRFLMRDKDTCGDARGCPESIFQRLRCSPTAGGLRPSRQSAVTSPPLLMRPALLAGPFLRVSLHPSPGCPVTDCLLPQPVTQ